jgi:hypothetical protein
MLNQRIQSNTSFVITNPTIVRQVSKYPSNYGGRGSTYHEFPARCGRTGDLLSNISSVEEIEAVLGGIRHSKEAGMPRVY